jgi:hypothetical protein
MFAYNSEIVVEHLKIGNIFLRHVQIGQNNPPKWEFKIEPHNWRANQRA